MRDGSQCRMCTVILYFLFRWHGEASDVSYAKTAVVQVIARFMPQHGNSKGHWPVRTFNQPFKVLEHVLQQIFGAQILSWNKDRNLPSQVVISAVLTSGDIGSLCVCFHCQLSTYIAEFVQVVAARTWHISLQKSALGTNTQGNCYCALKHTQELSILNWKQLHVLLAIFTQ
jgi:hypothetical protein